MISAFIVGVADGVGVAEIVGAGAEELDADGAGDAAGFGAGTDFDTIQINFFPFFTQTSVLPASFAELPTFLQRPFTLTVGEAPDA